MAPLLACLTSLLPVLPTSLALPTSNSADCSPPAHTLATLQQEMPTLSGLPSNQNVTLKYVAVGVGHQNYTCSAGAYVQTASGDGALATLYDATNYFANHRSAIPTLPAQRLSQYQNGGQNQALADFNPILPVLGEHFFDAAVRPNFDLYGAQPQAYLLAAKADAVPSPTAGDIAWLLLENNPAGGLTQGLSAVYRVQTAGGTPPTSCGASGAQLQVAYAAEYWFFE